MATYNIVAVSGSLRKGSYNSALLRALKERAPEDTTIEILDISGLAVYDQDVDANFPAEVQAMKAKIAAADGIILATPEYNRSMSSAMKNFIDWSSRPYGTGPWGGKLVAVIGASMAHTGAMMAQSELKLSLLFLGASVIGQPEFYLGAAHEKISAEGVLTDEDTKTHLDAVLTTLKTHIDKAR
jgi:NAD(P)H-dependent FMN reductase